MTQLYEDFSRFPPAQEDPGSTLSDEGALEGDDLETRVVADRTVVNSGGGEFEGPSLKDKGNACFRSGDWDGAVELYSRAIDCPVPAHELMHGEMDCRIQAMHVDVDCRVQAMHVDVDCRVRPQSGRS